MVRGRGRRAQSMALLTVRAIGGNKLAWKLFAALTVVGVGAHGAVNNRAEVRPLIFIHIPKTGGTSITAAFGTRPELGFALPTAECAGVPVMEARYKKHASASTAKKFYSDKEWQAAYKFVIVRNPWERLVSEWAMKTRSDSTFPEAVAKCGCDGTVTTPKVKTETTANTLLPHEEMSTDPSIGDASYLCPFSYYINECVHKEHSVVDGINITNWIMDATNPAAMGNGSNLLSQLEFIADDTTKLSHATELQDSNVLVDFVGRTENLTAHFEEAMIAAGNSRAIAAACTASLPHIDESSAGHDVYTAYYVNGHLEHRAQQMFKLDADAFGYEYGVDGPFKSWTKKAF